MEQIKHECGVAMVRLLKPIQHYEECYGSCMYGLNKLYLMMEKQHNRGQEGAGVACVRLNAAPGEEYMFRERAGGTSAITEVFSKIGAGIEGAAKSDSPFIGELYMGHLRYSTTGKSGMDYIHPFLRRNNWRAKNLALCGNFNLTNVKEVFDKITANGQHPRKYADTYILLEQVGHRLDREIERCYGICREEGLSGMALTHRIEEMVDLGNVLRESAVHWDGGYVICGITGSGEMFAMRDPWGIRTAFWYHDDEKLVLTSERPVIQTALNVESEHITELQPGEALLVDKSGRFRLEQILSPEEKRACQFERIYFSRGSDEDIYRERKEMGRELAPRVLEAISNDIDNTVVSYIPNTAEVAYYGLMEGLNDYLDGEKLEQFRKLRSRGVENIEEMKQILSRRVRTEKVAIKDIKLRTFISEGNVRNDLAAHVYDITYGSLRAGEDNLVIIDDSIVRGTTLRESIIGILDRLHPKKIVIVSSSPQIRYPDYYGIDMSSLDQFIAFKAAIDLLKACGMTEIIANTYRCIEGMDEAALSGSNAVKEIYAPFTDREISDKIAEMLKPENVATPVEIIFQSIEGQRRACPAHRGDWYFSGDYPTAGGYRAVNKAFIDYCRENEEMQEIIRQHKIDD